MKFTNLKAILLLCLMFGFSLSALAFDHTHKQWGDTLSQYVTFKDGQSYFDYKKLKNSSESSMKNLNNYLGELSAVTQSEYDQFNKNQRFSFLVNAYNAFTIKIIVDNYPVKSIKDIGTIFTSTWKIKFFELFGEKTHLDHIEHGLLRKKFSEPRVHFAVNCASMGCPNLLDKPFTESNLEELLAKGEKEFFAQSSKNRLDLKNNIVYASKIFDWFGVDFVKKHGSLKKYLAKAFNEPNVKAKKVKVKFTDYGWGLNEL